MTATRNRGEKSNLLARGVGIGLVVALAGLLLVGFSFSRHPGFGMMGQSNSRFDQTVCTPPTSFQSQTINVTVSDMGMMMGSARRMNLVATPGVVTAGKVNILVTNFGMRTHEVVVMPLSDGQSAGERVVGPDGKVDETGSVGEISNNCASGSGDGIFSGSRGWNTLTLTPGRYELICNLPNHYSAGMYQEIVVTP